MSDKHTDALLPCPFCGAAPIVDGKDECLRIRCETCGVQGATFYFNQENDEEIEQAERNAIAAWNRRATEGQAQTSAVRQYYYKVTGCKANNSTAADCICWHDEGTGPLKADPDSVKTWRAAQLADSPVAQTSAAVDCPNCDGVGALYVGTIHSSAPNKQANGKCLVCKGTRLAAPTAQLADSTAPGAAFQQTRFIDEIDAARAGEAWLDQVQTSDHTRAYVSDMGNQAPKIKWAALFDQHDKLTHAFLLTRDLMNWTQITFVGPAAPTAQQSRRDRSPYIFGVKPPLSITAQQSLMAGGAVPDSRPLMGAREDDEPEVNSSKLYHWRAGWNAYRDAFLTAAPLPQVQSEVLDELKTRCLTSIAAGHGYYDEYESWHCATCDADIGDGQDHSKSCITVRAGDYLASLDQQPVTPSGALADNDGGVK